MNSKPRVHLCAPVEPKGPPAAAARRAMKLPVGGEQPSMQLPSAGETDRPAGLLLLLVWPCCWCWSPLAIL